MIQEEKELLLVDLCAKLPYEVFVYVNGNIERADEINPFERLLTCGFQSFDIEDCKPYLRPMLSMTEGEKEELEHIMGESVIVINEEFNDFFYVEDTYQWSNLCGAIDWLNAHHFDYRGLIEKGLALEAPGGMYNNFKNLQNMAYKYFPSEFSSYEDYVKYLKEKGFAIEVTEENKK